MSDLSNEALKRKAAQPPTRRTPRQVIHKPLGTDYQEEQRVAEEELWGRGSVRAAIRTGKPSALTEANSQSTLVNKEGNQRSKQRP